MGNDNVKDYPPYLDYPKPRKPQTNADKIRAMTDEEIARWIANDLIEPGYYSGDQCYKLWLDWLKQECET